MKSFDECKSSLEIRSVMEDAKALKSRKQDRKNGLLGWWVSQVLNLPNPAWKLVTLIKSDTYKEGGKDV